MKAKVCFYNCRECQTAKIDGSCSRSFFYTKEEAIAMIEENCNINFINSDIAGEVIEQYCEYILGITVTTFPVKVKVNGIVTNSNTFTIFPVNGDSFMVKLSNVKLGELVQY